jgi:hypothetical protein
VVNIFHCFFGGKSINIEEALFELCFGGLCMAPRAPAVMTISGVVFHPLCAMSFIRIFYFSYFSNIFSRGNLTLQYVNSTNWIVTVGVGACGGGLIMWVVEY